MMHSLIVALTFVVAGMALPQTGGTCNSGSLQCCNSVQSSSSDNSGTLLSGLVPVNLQGLTGSVGLDCSPINVLGIGSSGCNQQTACCSGDTYGTVTLACNPINLNL
ncbi:hypothetical protein ACCO45_006380 [Purpureocillium lilacinum]|uniref:Uncharacterized protein n=1 Tax=Purpureocillium lilacinum TaxID=33203 RepID=A0ACC4DQC5_PURLI